MADFETDYLIVGAGAVGLAFADTLIDEDADCHITFIDKHHKPGGHWNDAYSFVALHQPSATYGVNSVAFDTEQIDEYGPNAGLYALASGTEVLAYFEKVMNKRLLPSGRVAYHRMAEFVGRDAGGDARMRAVLSGAESTIKVRRKIVDATFYQTSVPATHTRNFTEAPDVSVVPPGDLPGLWKQKGEMPPHYVILGAGKTAMDTAIWLIESGVDPDDISWVRPRESWLWNRIYTQPGEDFFENVMRFQIGMLEAAANAADGDEMMEIMGRYGFFLKIDQDAKPEMCHFATISQGEVDILRRIEKVIRNGRVTSVENGRLSFADGAVEVPEGSLFIDCTASAVPFAARRGSGPLFQGDRILLQPLQTPLVTFSAALAAFIEANFEGDDAKNALATPGPLTDSPATFPYAQMVNMMNRGIWTQNPQIMAWLAKSRLDLATGMIVKLVAEGSPKLALVQQVREKAQQCMPALVRLGMQAKAIHEAE